MSTAWERRAAGLLGSYSTTLGSIDSTVAASGTAVTFSDFATAIRVVTDTDGNPVMQDTAEGQSPQTFLAWEGPANLVKPGTPRFISEGGGREDIGDWQAQTPLDYNPEPGDIFLCNGYSHFVKGSSEGITNAQFLTVYLLRKGRDNEGF